MSSIKGTFLLIFLTFFVTACGHSTAGREDVDPGLKKMHIDANLLFALALPAPWKKADHEQWPATPGSSVTWRSDDQEPGVAVRVTSRPPETARGGFSRLKADFLAQRPDIEEISSTEAVINGRPALMVTGRFADRKTLIVFITTYDRAFSLEFTTSAGEFAAYRPLFKEILQSFHVL